MTTTTLFQPYPLGPLTLANRIVMAPLTRNRADAGLVPSPLASTYYAQRASAGLIVSEGTQISQQGQGYAWTPGIYSAEQVAGWKAVTDAVHAKGGKIVIPAELRRELGFADGDRLVFEREGNSLILVRTAKGRELFRNAEAAGVVKAEAFDTGSIFSIQPFQYYRRTTILPRLLAMKLLLLGEPIDADTAKRIGLVAEVLDELAVKVGVLVHRRGR